MRRPFGLLVVLSAPLLVAGLVLGAAHRGAQQPGTEKADGAKPASEAPPDPLPRLRTIARMMVNIETRHRAQSWELEALARHCDKNRSDDALRLAIRTAHAEADDYEARMQGFERDLGVDLFRKMRAAMDAGPGTAPRLRALLPDPPPPPPLLPHEADAREAEKRAGENAGVEDEDGKDGRR